MLQSLCKDTLSIFLFLFLDIGIMVNSFGDVFCVICFCFGDVSIVFFFFFMDLTNCLVVNLDFFDDFGSKFQLFECYSYFF